MRHSTNDALITVHWLRVPEPIEYKIALLTFRVLQGSALRHGVRKVVLLSLNPFPSVSIPTLRSIGPLNTAMASGGAL